MNILIACEFSGRVREAFAKLGHVAVSCDLLPTTQPVTNNSHHYQGNIKALVNTFQGNIYNEHNKIDKNLLHTRAFLAKHEIYTIENFDILIAHPPCTYLAVSGLHRNLDNTDRQVKTEEALDFVKYLMALPIKKQAIENPRSCISTRIRKVDQIIQPYEFGDDASKETWLWLKRLPKLKPTAFVQPRLTATGKKRWANQLDCGNIKIGNQKTRASDRSVTFQGIADAFADQWGTL